MRIKYLLHGFIVAASLMFLGCNDASVWECAEGETAKDGVCIPKTCEADGYQCPTCDTDIGEELLYADDESGFCKLTSCKKDGVIDEDFKWVDINETTAECVAKTCETDSYQCPTCNEPWEELFFADDEGGYCKITSCPIGEKVVEINATTAECVVMTCRDDAYNCPTCESYEKMIFDTDGNGICIAKTCREDAYGCPSCPPPFLSLGYVGNDGVCIEKSCAYPKEGRYYSLSNMSIPYCKIGSDEVYLGLGSGASAIDDLTYTKLHYFATDNGYSSDCGTQSFCTNSDDKIFLLTHSEFTPAILEFSLIGESSARLIKIIKLKDRNNQYISPFFHPIMETNSSKHAFDRNNQAIATDTTAMNVKAVAKLTSDRGYWVGDSYLASIAHVSETGIISKRFVPKDWNVSTSYDINDSLPAALTKRQVYAGIEALAVDEDNAKLYFMTAKPLNGDVNTNIRIYTVSLNSDLNDLAIPVAISNDHNYTLQNANNRVSDMEFKDGKLFLIEDDGSNSRVYGYNLTTHAVWEATDSTLNLPTKMQGLAPTGSAKYLLINDNDFGQNGEKNDIVFVDLNTTGV